MKRQRSAQGASSGTFNKHQQLVGLVLICLLFLPPGVGKAGLIYWTGGGGLDDDWSLGTNWSNGLGPAATDTAIFNAADTGNTNVVNTDFVIVGLQYLGNGTHTTDFAGTNKLQVNGPVYAGYGGSGDGATITWTGTGSAQIGTTSSPQALYVGVNTSGGTNTSSLSLVDGPEVSLNGSLTIGYRSGGNVDGKLILGDNSKLHVGTPSTLADLAIGYGYTHNSGTATGLFEALHGQADLHLNELNVGYNYAAGSTTGTLTTGDGTALRATSAYVSRGPAATGTVNLTGGLFAADVVNMGAGGTFNFTGGRLAANRFNTYAGTGTLLQQGGTLAPGFSLSDRLNTSLPGFSIINGNYELDAGLLEIELFGKTPGTGYDQLQVNGLVNLNGGALDLLLDFGPALDDEFIIIKNDGTDAVLGQFAGLPQGAWFSETYGGLPYSFQINYFGGTGNDVVLKVVIPAPGAIVLGGIGIGLLGWLRRRRMV